MKIKKGFVLREILGEYAVVYEGLEQIDFNKIISLNPSAVVIWKNIEGKEFDVNTVADILVDEYQIDRELALKDAKSVLDKFIEIKVVE